jgi:hypothetical protein
MMEIYNAFLVMDAVSDILTDASQKLEQIALENLDLETAEAVTIFIGATTENARIAKQQSDQLLTVIRRTNQYRRN